MTKTLAQIVLICWICLVMSGSLPARSQQGDGFLTATTGEGYRLTTVPPSSCAPLTGDGYVLTPAVVAYTGNGCCCVYLPLVTNR